MDYKTACEELSKALWAYEKTHGQAFERMMRQYRRIENELEKPLPPLRLAPGEKGAGE